jgi:hypothetical protein
VCCSSSIDCFDIGSREIALLDVHTVSLGWCATSSNGAPIVGARNWMGLQGKELGLNVLLIFIP